MIFYGLLGAVTIALACLVNRESVCRRGAGGTVTRRQAMNGAVFIYSVSDYGRDGVPAD